MYVNFSSCQYSSSVLLHRLSFPCNMSIRCNIRWDLFLLRAQNLVATSGFCGWHAKYVVKLFSFHVTYHVDMKPRAPIMQSRISPPFFFFKWITLSDKVGSVVLCFHSCSELGAKKTIAACTHLHSSCCRLPRPPLSFLSSHLSR